MLVLITYDVSTSSEGGQKRLRHVAKVCQKYGQRVQNSVFECIVDSTQYMQLRIELESLIDENKDSVRLFQIGKKHKKKVSYVCVKEVINLNKRMFFLL